MYYTLERRAYFFKCFTISSAALASHSNKCPPLCWYNMTSYSTRPWETNGTNRDGHWLLYWYCDQKKFLGHWHKIWPIRWRTECFSESEEVWTNKQYYTCSHSHVLLRINISPEVKGQWEFILPPSLRPHQCGPASMEFIIFQKLWSSHHFCQYHELHFTCGNHLETDESETKTKKNLSFSGLACATSDQRTSNNVPKTPLCKRVGVIQI